LPQLFFSRCIQSTGNSSPFCDPERKEVGIELSWLLFEEKLANITSGISGYK
jgi:hypothetical protein